MDAQAQDRCHRIGQTRDQVLRLHPEHPVWRRGNQLDRGGHGDLLRLRLEPDHGCSSSRPVPSDWPDQGCPHLQVGQRTDCGGEYFEEGKSKKDFLETLPLREATSPRPSSKSPPSTIYLTTRQPTLLWMMMKSQWKRLVQHPKNPLAPLKMLLPLPKMLPTFWRQRRQGRKRMLMKMTSKTKRTSSMLCWQN